MSVLQAFFTRHRSSAALLGRGRDILAGHQFDQTASCRVHISDSVAGAAACGRTRTNPADK